MLDDFARFVDEYGTPEQQAAFRELLETVPGADVTFGDALYRAALLDAFKEDAR
ncbi:hypothetical protein [Carbonactinospora thermoautotrophica]|uniref:hypothetical protein n=1 Tax=Carbonactinospora thermoautotrophica TaxID=1469144 RepID=UPI001300F623|nr:hypothetical protein [Carbonactinospora thermoautotrophica]